MVAITVLMLVPKSGTANRLPIEEDRLIASAARMCVMPAHRLGFSRPGRLHALVMGLLNLAQSRAYRSETGVRVCAEVRYLGNGTFQVNVEVQSGLLGTYGAVQETYSGGVVSLRARSDLELLGCNEAARQGELAEASLRERR